MLRKYRVYYMYRYKGLLQALFTALLLHGLQWLYSKLLVEFIVIYETEEVSQHLFTKLITSSLNKDISESNIVTRSATNNTLRPCIGNKMQTSNLKGQVIHLWNKASDEFKMQ